MFPQSPEKWPARWFEARGQGSQPRCTPIPGGVGGDRSQPSILVASQTADQLPGQLRFVLSQHVRHLLQGIPQKPEGRIVGRVAEVVEQRSHAGGRQLGGKPGEATKQGHQLLTAAGTVQVWNQSAPEIGLVGGHRCRILVAVGIHQHAIELVHAPGPDPLPADR